MDKEAKDSQEGIRRLCRELGHPPSHGHSRFPPVVGCLKADRGKADTEGNAEWRAKRRRDKEEGKERFERKGERGEIKRKGRRDLRGRKSE